VPENTTIPADRTTTTTAIPNTFLILNLLKTVIDHVFFSIYTVTAVLTGERLMCGREKKRTGICISHGMAR
jgi:hypothetical protein